MSIRLKIKGTSHGVKLAENKFTAGSAIEPLPLPEKVIIPLQQHIGAPCEAVVKKGGKVLTGQKIGEPKGFVSVPVYATISGGITGITMVINPPTAQMVTALVITSDGKDEWVELKPPDDPEALSVKEILDRVRAAGIVGLGGDTSPTHVKLSPPKDKKIDTVILNGCECEPYITSDHRVMLEYGKKVLSGLNIIRKVLSPDNVYIAIEDNKADVIDHLEKLIVAMGFKEDFKIIPLKSKYPMGAEKILIKTLLSREVPIGGSPLDVGVVVHNVSTAKAIHDAVVEGRPFVERVVTVTGAVKNPKNLLVRLGTPLRSLIDYCGGMERVESQESRVESREGRGTPDSRLQTPDSRLLEVILGGPMMGISQPDLDFPVTKGTNCVLVRESRPIREQDCISCGRCLEVCPMHLIPTMLAKYAKAGRYDDCKKVYYIDNCFECGTCAYVCPANIPIVQYTKVAKRELMKRAAPK